MNLQEFKSAVDDSDSNPDESFIDKVMFEVVRHNDWYEPSKRRDMLLHFLEKRPEVFKKFAYLQLALFQTIDNRYRLVVCDKNDGIGGSSFYSLNGDLITGITRNVDDPDCTHVILVDLLIGTVQLFKGDSVEPFRRGLDVNNPGWKLGEIIKN